MLSRGGLNINEVVSILEMDLAKSLNIMRSANSARCGGRFQIEKLQDAIVRLRRSTSTGSTAWST